MNPDDTRRDTVPAQRLFDPSRDWLRAAAPAEPDFTVDGLRHASVVERLMRLLGRRRD